MHRIPTPQLVCWQQPHPASSRWLWYWPRRTWRRSDPDRLIRPCSGRFLCNPSGCISWCRIRIDWGRSSENCYVSQYPVCVHKYLSLLLFPVFSVLGESEDRPVEVLTGWTCQRPFRLQFLQRRFSPRWTFWGDRQRGRTFCLLVVTEDYGSIGLGSWIWC